MIYYFSTGFILLTIILARAFKFAIYANKPEVIAVLNWLGTLQNRIVHTKQDEFSKTLDKVNRYSEILTPFVKNMFIIAYICENAGLFLYSLIVNKEKYPLFLHKAYLFGVKPWNIWIYGINIVNQLYGVFVSYSFILFTFYLTVIFAIHAIVYMEAIEVLISAFEEEFKADEFDEWIKMVATEIHNIKTHLSLYTDKIFCWAAYVGEKAEFSSFIIIWLAFKVEPGLAPWAIVCVITMILSYGLVLINEKILEKVGQYQLRDKTVLHSKN